MNDKNKQGETEQIHYIPLDQIMLSTENRSHIADASFKELVESIKQTGVFTTVVVRPLKPELKKGKNKNKLYEMIAGERRYHGSVEAKKETIPSRIIAATDDQASEIRLMENIHRKDLHPLDELAAFEDYLKHEGHDKDILSQKIGKSKQYIDDRLRLSNLVPIIKTQFQKGYFKYAHCFLFARLQSADQLEAYKRIAMEHNGKLKEDPESPGDLKSWIRNHIDLDLKKAPFDINDEKLFVKAGSCLSCVKNTGCDGQLFPGLVEKSICTDSVCYKSKLQLYINNKVKEIKEEYKKDPVMVTTGYGDQQVDGNKLIGYLNYKVIGKSEKKCATTVPAIIMDGYNKVEIGHVIMICREKKCNTHFSFSGSGSRNNSAAEKAKQEKARLETKFKQELLKEVLSKFLEYCTGKKLYQNKPEAHLITISKRMYDRTEYNEQKEYIKFMGIETTKADSRGYAQVNKLLDNAATEAGVRQFLLGLSLYHETRTSSWGTNKYENLKKHVKEFKINDKVILKALQKTASEKKAKAEIAKSKKVKSKTKKKAA